MKVNIESSTSCNAKCVFCPRYEMTRPMGQMSDEVFHKVIKDCKEMGVNHVSPFMNGEPFVFPKIWEWLDYMVKEGIWVSIYTNGEFIDVDRFVKYKNIHYLDFSINAATKETYDKVMRGPDFDRVVRNFWEARKKANFMVRASMVTCEENIHEVDLFRRTFRRTKVCGYSNWTGARHSSIERKGKRIPCYPLMCQMFVLWDGRVVPCCMDYNGKQILGDVKKNSLREIWNNARWMRIKHRKLEFDIPVCSVCNYNVDDGWI